jgi:hypothetical protein
LEFWKKVQWFEVLKFNNLHENFKLKLKLQVLDLAFWNDLKKSLQHKTSKAKTLLKAPAIFVVRNFYIFKIKGTNIPCIPPSSWKFQKWSKWLRCEGLTDCSSRRGLPESW